MINRENYCGRCRMHCFPGSPCTHCQPIARPHTMARDAVDAYEERVPGAPDRTPVPLKFAHCAGEVVEWLGT